GLAVGLLGEIRREVRVAAEPALQSEDPAVRPLHQLLGGAPVPRGHGGEQPPFLAAVGSVPQLASPDACRDCCRCRVHPKGLDTPRPEKVTGGGIRRPSSPPSPPRTSRAPPGGHAPSSDARRSVPA